MQSPLIHIEEPRLPGFPRLPEWVRKGATHFESLHKLKSDLRALNLHTVCESARCPNIHECFHRGAATFMILGNLCTRGCGFCSVPKGTPRIHDMPLDPAEPENIARLATAMRYVTPEQFDRYRTFGLSLGFKMVFSEPLVRSSYMADLVSEQAARA